MTPLISKTLLPKTHYSKALKPYKRQSMSLHVTVSTPLLSPGKDLRSVAESTTLSPSHCSVQKKNPGCALSPCPRNHAQSALCCFPRPSHRSDKPRATPGNASRPRVQSRTPRPRHAAETWHPKRQHTT